MTIRNRMYQQIQYSLRAYMPAVTVAFLLSCGSLAVLPTTKYQGDRWPFIVGELGNCVEQKDLWVQYCRYL